MENTTTTETTVTPPQGNDAQQNLPGVTQPEQNSTQQVTPVVEEKSFDIKVSGEIHEIKESDIKRYAGLSSEDKLDDKTTKALIRAYQKEVDSDAKYQQSANMHKQATAFVEALIANPIAVLTNPNLPIKFRDIAINYVKQELEREDLSPAERKALELEEQLKQIEDERKYEQQSRQQQEFEEKSNQYYNQYVNEAIPVIRDLGMPETQNTMARLGFYIEQSINKGYELSVKEAAELVKEDLDGEMKAYFAKATPEIIEQFLGNDGVKKIQKHLLSKAKDPLSNPAVNGQQQAPLIRQSQEQNKPLTREEIINRINKRAEALDAQGGL